MTIKKTIKAQNYKYIINISLYLIKNHKSFDYLNISFSLFIILY